ncbi:hypothetical protein HZB01_02215 [Candidatus Woesearchaeota archaeon]|nr:hypothetical protein [Candidatus Woesearchaeota archaeon]
MKAIVALEHRVNTTQTALFGTNLLNEIIYDITGKIPDVTDLQVVAIVPNSTDWVFHMYTLERGQNPREFHPPSRDFVLHNGRYGSGAGEQAYAGLKKELRNHYDANGRCLVIVGDDDGAKGIPDVLGKSGYLVTNV